MAMASSSSMEQKRQQPVRLPIKTISNSFGAQPLLLRQLMRDPAMASILAVALATVILLIAFVNRGSGRRKRLPPSPRSLPVIGHLHLVHPPVHRTFHDLAARVGPLMHIRLGSTHCAVASSAAVAGEFIGSHEGKISERPLTAVVRQFAYGSDGFTFAPYSSHWRFMKRLCMSELLGPRTVEQLRPVRHACVVSLLQRVLASSSSEVDLTGALIRLSNTSIIRMMASTVPGSVTEEAQALVKAVAELAGAFNVEDYISVCRGWDLQGLGRRAADVHRRFDALLEDMIRHKEEAREARRTRGDVGGEPTEKKSTATAASKDLLDILLDKMEEETAAEVKLTRNKIKAFVTEMVTAGSDSSAAMIEWTLAELMNHPECLRKVRGEIDAVVGRGRIAGEGDVASLPYLQAACKETLRLRPAAPIVRRQSTEEMELAAAAGGGGYTVPAGTAVFINVWAIGRDPACWDAPLEFRPERFMDGGGNEGLDPRGQHFKYLPFGSGRRACPGMGLVLQFVPAVVGALVQCFDWAVVPGAGGKSKPTVLVDMEEVDGLVCARKHPLLLRASPRLSPFPAIV